MDKQQNFGKALKQLRESKEIDLDKISQFTKIHINNLNNLEKGDFSFASMIYVKLFLREYLKYIDPSKVDEIMNKFEDVNNITSSRLTFLPLEGDDIDNKNIEDIDNNSDPVLNDEYFTPKKIGIIILTIIIIVFIIQFSSYLSASSSSI